MSVLLFSLSTSGNLFMNVSSLGGGSLRELHGSPPPYPCELDPMRYVNLLGPGQGGRFKPAFYFTEAGTGQ